MHGRVARPLYKALRAGARWSGKYSAEWLTDSKSRRATACAYFGLYDGEHMVVMNGEIHGTIADHPRGENDFAHGGQGIPPRWL